MKEQLIGNNRSDGFAILEILIAFAVIILSTSAVIMLSFSNQKVAVDSQISIESISKSEALLEKARADSRYDFNLVNSTHQNPASGNCQIDYISDGIYCKKIEVNEDPSVLFTKKVTSTVTWKMDGRNLSTVFTTLLTNPDVYDGGNTCSSVLTNPEGWKNPTYYTFPSVNFNGPNANGIQMSNLDVFNKKLYVVASNSPNPNPENFFILGLPDDPSQNPTVLGSLDNNNNSLVGLNAVMVAGNYAYVTNAYGSNFNTCTQGANCSQLQVIDISNPSSPSVTKSIKVPGVTGSAGQAIGKSVFYNKGYLYLGLAKTNSGPEFNIFDVGGGSGSPTNPIWKGGYQIGNDINSIFVKNGYAYIASPNSKNLIILDITNPANPIYTDGYTPVSGLNNGKSITVVGDTAYLGRTFGSDEFQILNVSNRNNISLIAKKDIGSTNQTSINGLLIRDYLAFFVTLSQFQVWDISNHTNIKPWSQDGTTNTFLSTSLFGGRGVSTNCEGDRIYVAVSSSQGNNKDILAVLTPGNVIPSFNYSLSPSGDISIIRGGSSASNSITITMTPGATPQVVTITPRASDLPPGVTVNPSSSTCMPSNTNPYQCTTNLFTYSAALNATVGGPIPINIDGVNPNQTTSFNLNVSAPSFDYSLSDSGNIVVNKGGSPVTSTITITMNGGATPQVVTLTNSPLSSGVSMTYSPVSKSCTPSSTTPYKCTIVLSFSAISSAPNSNANVTITGSSLSTSNKTTTFRVRVQ